MKTASKYSGRKLKKPDMRKEGNFTQIPNAFILNPDIRDPELRLLQYIMMYSDNRTITTKNCILYLRKTKPAIGASFEKLIALGILKITDETIEVIIPEEMKKYKLGYLEGKENLTTEVKKTLPSESENELPDGKDNLTTEVKKTLPSGKENLPTEVKNSFEKTLDDADNDKLTNPIILSNNRVLPVPAKSGSTGQTHSNGNTKGKTGIELDLERDTLQSLASPSVLAPSLHTPKLEVDNGDKESTLPQSGDDYSDTLQICNETLPIVEVIPPKTNESKPIPIKPDKRFAEQVELYKTSQYFLQDNLSKVINLYIYYSEQYPNDYLSILDFEKLLVYLMTQTLRMVKMRGINSCLLYQNEIRNNFKYIPQIFNEIIDNQKEFANVLKNSEIKH